MAINNLYLQCRIPRDELLDNPWIGMQAILSSLFSSNLMAIV